MRNIFLWLSFMISFAANGQEIDSAWVRKAYFPGIARDTGIFLPKVDLVDEMGNKKLLSDFKGKILYIDIWETSCAPCIGQFPYSEQLLKRLKAIGLDTTIQFINICTGDSKEKWEDLLEKKHPSGLNFYSKTLDQKWNVNIWPTHFILDRSGKVLTTKAVSPDDALIDYMLYAATKGIKPAEAIWIYFNQYWYFRKNNKYTDDATGIDYSKWHSSTMESIVEFSKWRDGYQKRKSR